VGQVPKHNTEAQLLAIFMEFALVDEVNIIKDKITRASRGCCFLLCPSREEADKVVDACHNKRTLPGASNPLQVKYADGELERLEHKLFVGMLPKNVAEVEVAELFSTYGTIRELLILRGSQQTSKGCAFLKYDLKEQAVAAIEALNGIHQMEGSTVPLVVKWADTEKERLARKAQKAQVTNIAIGGSSPNQSLYGSMPLMGYIPPYNGYGYQARGTYGPLPYRMPQVQNHQFQNMIPPQGNTPRGVTPDHNPSMGPRNYPMTSAGYVGSNFQYPMAYQNGPSAASSNVGVTSGGQMEGPSGANLFIYHIPQEFGDQELASTFQEFGRIVSAKVFVDKATGASKCFGFVSFDSPEAAQTAINVMNGFQLGAKKLKVQLKRDNKRNTSY
jgi:CUG-BP- and ETR3-like factor